MMYTMPKYVNWYRHRFTPHHGTKGYVTTALFSAFYDVWRISISDRGITARWKNDRIQTHHVRKDVTIDTITLDYTNMFKDMISYFTKKNIFKCDIPGLALGASMQDMLKGFHSFFKALEYAELLGTHPFFQKNVEQCWDDFSDAYVKIIKRKMMDNKFNKAETSLARRAIEKYLIAGNLGIAEMDHFTMMRHSQLQNM